MSIVNKRLENKRNYMALFLSIKKKISPSKAMTALDVAPRKKDKRIRK